MIKNILTCDLEDWYHTTLVNAEFENWDEYDQRVLASTYKVLEILDKTDTKITFFVLGYVAEKYPKLIEEISNMGHEIASHSYRHCLVYDLTPDEFNEDLRKSIVILSSICGKKINGFRAPSWSIYKEKQWPLEILQDNEISYDSSLYPFKTFLYGNNDYPRFGHQIDVRNKKQLFELPPSVGEIAGKRVPFSGGFFLRLLPYWLLKGFINSYNRKNQPAVLYFHPWEIDEDQPKIDLKPRDKFIQYYNISSMAGKLSKLLEEYSFIPISQYFRENSKIINDLPMEVSN